MSNAVEKSMDDLLALSAERLKNKLPEAFNEIREYGIERLLQQHPDFLGTLLTQIRHADPAELFSRLPGVADQLMELLWAGVSYQAEQVKEMKTLLEKAE